MTATAIAWIVAAYLIGAVPFGYLIGLTHGIDIRTLGSGNIGATNVGRVLGRGWGLLCLLLDLLKGLTPTFTARVALLEPPLDSHQMLLWLAVGLAAVAGHVFPIYLGFRGGKGVATTIGMALGIWPYFAIPMLLALAAYALVRIATGIVSLGSLTLALVFAVAVVAYSRYEGLQTADAWPLDAAAGLVCLLIVLRHRSNIGRLLRGQEAALRPGSESIRSEPPDTTRGERTAARPK